VRKAQKHYHFDWTVVVEEPFRFENMIASHLLKWVHMLQDTEGRDIELRYFRDVTGMEVDFIVVENREPKLMVECKIGDQEISKPLAYLKRRFPKCESWQISMKGKKDFISGDGIRVANAAKFLERLV